MIWYRKADRQKDIINFLCNGSVHFNQHLQPIISETIDAYIGSAETDKVKRMVAQAKSFYWLDVLYVSLCLQMCQESRLRSPKLDGEISRTFWDILTRNSAGALEEFYCSMESRRVDDVNFFLEKSSGRDFETAQSVQMLWLLSFVLGQDAVLNGTLNLAPVGAAYAQATTPIIMAFKREFRRNLVADVAALLPHNVLRADAGFPCSGLYPCKRFGMGLESGCLVL